MGTRRIQVPAILTLLFAGTFVMGCAEVAPAGMLDLIAHDLAVPIPAAGALVSANALGIAVGGPLLALLTTSLDRKAVAVGTLVSFVVLNLPAAFGMGLDVLIPARLFAGSAQGCFIATAITTAINIVSPARAGSAIAVVISGFAVSGAVGMPLGSWLGQALGWQATFVAVVIVGTAVVVSAMAVVPSVTAQRESVLSQLKYAFAPRVLVVLGAGMLIFAGTQSALTYVVPFMGQISRVTGPLIGVFLLFYGVAGVIGSFFGGRFADARAASTIIAGSSGTVVALLTLFLFGSVPVIVALALVCLGLSAMGVAAPLQHRVTNLAGPGAAFAASLPASAANLGDALGAYAGGLAIDRGGLAAAMITGVGIAAFGTICASISSRQRLSNVKSVAQEIE